MLTTFTLCVPVVFQFGLFICLRSGGRGIHPASRRVPAWWGRDQRWWSLWVQSVPKWRRGVVGEGKVGLSPRLQQRGRWSGGGRVSSHRQRRHCKLQRVAAGRIQWWGETQSFRGTVLTSPDDFESFNSDTHQKLITGGNYAHLCKCGVSCENGTFHDKTWQKTTLFSSDFSVFAVFSIFFGFLRFFRFFRFFFTFFTNSKLIKTNRYIQKGMFFPRKNQT